MKRRHLVRWAKNLDMHIVIDFGDEWYLLEREQINLPMDIVGPDVRISFDADNPQLLKKHLPEAIFFKVMATLS